MHLKEHREHMGLSVRRLAELSGVHYVTIVKLEGGKLDPQLSTLMKLCKALGVTLTELVGPYKPKGGRHGTHQKKG